MKLLDLFVSFMFLIEDREELTVVDVVEDTVKVAKLERSLLSSENTLPGGLID